MTSAHHAALDPDSLAAAAIAFEAGQLLLEIRASSLADGVTASGLAADNDADRLIAERLAESFPHDAVLSEETPDSSARLGRERVWIVDPLDGTREYNLADRTDWAVHVALFAHGRLCAGAVALPAAAMLFSTAAPFPAPPRPAGPLRFVVSRSRPPRLSEIAAQRLGAELVPMGSAGAKAMAVVRGEVDAYLHSGGQWEWDSAAPIAVANACGLHTSRVDGSPFAWNQPRPWQPDLLICRRELAEPILAAIADELD